MVSGLRRRYVHVDGVGLRRHLAGVRRRRDADAVRQRPHRLVVVEAAAGLRVRIGDKRRVADARPWRRLLAQLQRRTGRDGERSGRLPALDDVTVGDDFGVRCANKN